MSEMDEMRRMNKKPIAEANSTKTLSGAGKTTKSPVAKKVPTLEDKRRAAQDELHSVWAAKMSARRK